MKINISPPLRLLQWSSYACIILLVKVFIIFPLAVLLFHDLYSRLLPADSSNWVPFDTLQNIDCSWNKHGQTFTQAIKRVDTDYELPKTLDNGISQPIHLRDHILYKMDLNLQFYCIHMFTDKQRNNLMEFELQIFGTCPAHKLFSKKIPIVCLTEESQTELGVPSSIYGSSKLELYRKEWLNELKVDDKIKINPKLKSIKFVLQTKGPTQLILGPESGLKFRMHSPQGLINFMLRWRRTAYFVGIVLFDLAITTLFSTSALTTFSLFSGKLSQREYKNR